MYLVVHQVSRYGNRMADPWNFAGPVTQLDSGAGVRDPGRRVDLRHQRRAPATSTTGAAQGLFFRDTRILSRFEVLVNGTRTEPLPAVTDDPFSATFVSRCLPAPGRADSTLMVFRSPLRRPGHARGPDHPELRRRARLLHGRGVRRSRLRRPVRGQGGAGRDRQRRPPTWCRGSRRQRPQAAQIADGSPTADPRRRHTDHHLLLPAGRRGPRGGHPLPRPAMVTADLATFEVVVPARGEWTTCVEVGADHRRDAVRPAVPVRPADRAGHARRAAGTVAPPGAPGRDRPPGPEGGGRPQRRGPRRPADLRPRLPRAGGGGGRRPVVHDRVRPGLPADRVDGPAGRPRPGPRRAADAGPLPGEGRRPPPRRGAGSHPPRDALRRRRRRCRSAAGASTTAPPTPRRCS